METTTLCSKAKLIERVRICSKVPAPSAFVFKILSMTKDESGDVAAIAAVVAKDPGLTALLLRLANSAMYGGAAPTSSVQQACIRLGLKRVRSAVLNQEIVSGLEKAHPAGFDASGLWQHTLAISVAAQSLCVELMPRLTEDAATAGLLCDLGIGLMSLALGEDYQPVFEQYARNPDRPLHEVEREQLGLTHADVGAAVLRDWNIDPSIIHAVEHHHHETIEAATDEQARFSTIVAAGATLGAIALDGSNMERVSRLYALVEQLSEQADRLVGRMLDRLVDRIQETAQLLAVTLGDTQALEEHCQALDERTMASRGLW